MDIPHIAIMFMVNKKIFLLLLLTTLFVLPIIVLAGEFNAGNVPFAPENFDVGNIITGTITKTLNLIWILLVIFAIIMFIVAGFQFLAARGEPEGIKKAQLSVLWASVGLVVAIVAFSVPRILVMWFSGG